MSSDATAAALGLPIEEIRELIIDRAAREMIEDTHINLHGQIERLVQEKVAAECEAAMQPMVENGIETLVMQETNRWGEATGKAVTFREYVVARAEAYLTEKVNFDGKSKGEDSFSWKGTQTRLTHMVHQHLHYNINRAMESAMSSANNQLAAAIAETAKIKLEELAASLKVETKTRR